MTEAKRAVRPIAPDEVSRAMEVWLAANAARGVDSPQEHRAVVQRQLETTTDIALGYENSDGDVVGFVTGAPRVVGGEGVPGATQLLALFVSPAAQGTGAGSALMSAFLAAARDRGAPTIHLWVRASNAGARRLYERFGFHASEEGVKDDGGVAIIEYVRPADSSDADERT